MYQAKTPVRRCSGSTWESAACSMARKGPTSLPEGLMTPKVAASTSTVKSPLRAKGMPAASMRAAPTISIFLRPRRSAWRVIHSEMAVSPARVSVSSRPMRPSPKPRLAR